MTPLWITLEQAEDYVRLRKWTALDLSVIEKMTPEQINALTPEQRRNLSQKKVDEAKELARARSRAVVEMRRKWG